MNQIDKVIADAMGAIERENPTLKGVLPRDYARPSLDNLRLGGLVDIISNIGVPPVNNTNYGWIQYFIHHLSPVSVAGFIMANGSMSTQAGTEGDIRKTLIEADLVDCRVALPGQLPFTMQTPICLWVSCPRQKKLQTS